MRCEKKCVTLEVPNGMGIILRTAGEGVSYDELKVGFRLFTKLMGCNTGSKSTQESSIPDIPRK